MHTRSSNTEESKETQTESCMGSDKEATFRGHNGTDPKRNYSCNKCDELFDEKWEVMAHRKERHPSTVITCNFFV